MVVAYDIPDDRRRNRVMRILKDFGQHMQYSVFECRITEEDYVLLRDRLDRAINPETDSIRFYFLCGRCQDQVEYIGGTEPMGGPLVVI